MWKVCFPILATMFANIALAHGISDADKQAMLEGGLLQYIWLGATHMLTGYDHLLFIFGVIFLMFTASEIYRGEASPELFLLDHSISSEK